MEASVTLDHGMTFEATADSGFTLTLGADPAVGGENDGFRPMELMLMSLVGCMAMDVISILRKKRQHVTDFQVRAQAEQAGDYPRVFTNIHIVYIVQGVNVDAKAVERSIELSTTKYCPVQAMLKCATTITNAYEIIEVG